MGKFAKRTIIFASIATAVFVYANTASATVGGPMLVSHLGYKPGERAVYYIQHDGGGRGCPPIVHRIGLEDLEDKEVVSCAQAEERYDFSNGGYNRYEAELFDTLYKDVSYLGSVSLKGNGITIEVRSVKENFVEDSDWKVSTDFNAKVMQDGKLVGEFDFRGCSKDQPHVFEGYMILDSDEMALLLSNKGDCWEGGYVEEEVFILNGVSYKDKNVVRSYKEKQPTEPNLANMIVYADGDTGLTEKKPPLLFHAYIIAFALVISAIIIGLLVNNWKK